MTSRVDMHCHSSASQLSKLGVQRSLGLPDCFVSEELTARFRGEPQAVHVLCYGITSDDHEWLQGHSGDVEACAEYLHGNGIAAALAHPFFDVAAPLAPRHRRRLAESASRDRNPVRLILCDRERRPRHDNLRDH